MAFSHGTPNSIVTDGLIFCVDPANVLSWAGPDSSTVNDLIGTNNGTAVNDVSGSYGDNNSFDFDGVDDRITLGSQISLTDLSIGMWVNPGNAASPNTTLLLGLRTSNAYKIQFNSATQIAFKAGGNTAVTGTPAIANDEWQYLFITRTSDTIQWYLNGSTWGSASSVSTAAFIFDCIGYFNNGSKEWLGKIGPIQVYDKAILASEVTQNYNALKNRFRT